MGKSFFELLEARRRVKELEGDMARLQATIEQLQAEVVQPPKPEIELLSAPSGSVLQELQEKGVNLMYPILMDAPGSYRYTDRAGWAEVFNYIYLVFDMPLYIANRMDCEDFGILLKGLVSALFALNYFAFTVGQIPRGCHGFNFFKTEDGLMICEPQRAEFFEWGERDYKPEVALL